MTIIKKLPESNAKLMSDSYSGGQNTLKSPGRSHFSDKKCMQAKPGLASGVFARRIRWRPV